jgi:hypothetical protein
MKTPRRGKTWSFVQHNRLRRRNPEYAGGYCRFLSLLTREQAEEIRLAFLNHGIRCLVGSNPLTDAPYQHFVAVHTDSDFFAARGIAERSLMAALDSHKRKKGLA